MNKIIISVLSALVLSTSLFAQSISFANINSDARTLSLANAGVALGDGAFAAENNVASLALREEKFYSGINYTMWQPTVAKSNMISAALSYKLGERFAIGLNFKNLSQKEYLITGNTGQSKGSFKPKDMLFGLSLAFAFSDYFSAGVNAKYVISSLIPDVKGSSFMADIALKFDNKEDFTAGLSVNNLGPKMKYDGSEYALPSLVKAGASYKIAEMLLLSAQFDMCFKSGMGIGLGAEYCFADIAFVRAGYRYGSGQNSLPSFASVGLGVKYAGINLNVCYLLASKALANTLAFGLEFSF